MARLSPNPDRDFSAGNEKRDPEIDRLLAEPLIAIVDDYEAVRKGLESLLRSMGHNASTFGSAEDFLKSKKLYDASCLITDLQMPGLTGLDLQDRLIADGHRMPIIFVTAHTD